MHKEAVTLSSTTDANRQATHREHDNLNIEQLVQEAIQSVGKAKELLSDPLLAEKLSAEHLVKIAVSPKTQCGAGLIILRQKNFFEKLSDRDLTRIGISHFNFSKLVITRSEFLNKLSSEQITLIGKYQNPTANAIMEDAALYGRLAKQQIRELALEHSSVAKKVLTTPELTKYFTAEDLNIIIQKHPKVSHLVSSNAVIRKMLNPSNSKQDAEDTKITASPRPEGLVSGPQSEKSGVKTFLSNLSLSISKLWHNATDIEENQPLLSNVTISTDSKKAL